MPNNPNLRRRVDDAAMISGLICPVKFALCTYEFEDPDYKSHKGIDLVSIGTNGGQFTAGSDGNVYAATAGTVTDIRTGLSNMPVNAGSLGNFIRIRAATGASGANGAVSRYGHLASVNVSVGQAISQGQIIGVSGNTGSSTARHLHFDYQQNGFINPLKPASGEPPHPIPSPPAPSTPATPTASDALEILKQLVGLPNTAPPKSTATDALNILRRVASNNKKPAHHVVDRGETFSSIALKYGYTHNELRNANPQIMDINRINVGQIIILP